MRFKFLTLVSLVCFSTSALASESAQMSIGLSGLKISREREVIEPKEGSSETRNTSAVDLFGIDGRSALPSLELGLSIGKVVVYAYPNAAAGGREIWLGMKVAEQTEIGVLAGTNHLAFSPKFKVESATQMTNNALPTTTKSFCIKMRKLMIVGKALLVIWVALSTLNFGCRAKEKVVVVQGESKKISTSGPCPILLPVSFKKGVDVECGTIISNVEKDNPAAGEIRVSYFRVLRRTKHKRSHLYSFILVGQVMMVRVHSFGL